MEECAQSFIYLISILLSHAVVCVCMCVCVHACVCVCVGLCVPCVPATLKVSATRYRTDSRGDADCFHRCFILKANTLQLSSASEASLTQV